MSNMNLADTIKHLLDLTKNMPHTELMKLWRSGQLPTGIRDFIIACNKADQVFNKGA